MSTFSAHPIVKRRAGRDWIILGLALLFWAFVVLRASVQSVTIDEADTYLGFAARPDPLQWYPSSNNHILNSLLMRFLTIVFGVSHFVVRIPALIGAALYISSVAYLCRLAPSSWISSTMLICLVANPFLQDYLVAARGYGLALGFLALAIALAVASTLHWPSTPPTARLAWISISLALCVSANFSFAFAAVAAGLVIGVILWRHHADHMRWSASNQLRFIAWGILPGLAVFYFLCGYTLLVWPRGEFTHGATSIRESLHSIVEDCLYEVNPHVVNPRVRDFLMRISNWLPALFLGVSVARILESITSAWRRKSAATTGEIWAIGLTAALLVTCVLHYAAWRLYGLKLPFHRTACFIPVFLFLATFFSTLQGEGRTFPLRQKSTIGVLVTLAFYFLCCARLTYFKEWKYNSDAERIYATLSRESKNIGPNVTYSHWRYRAALSFCRAHAQEDVVGPLLESPSSEARLFVLYFPEDEPFIRSNHLTVLYRNDETGGTVARRPSTDELLFPRLARRHSPSAVSPRSKRHSGRMADPATIAFLR